MIISISFIKIITKHNVGKKSDILVIYPELNMSRSKRDNNYSFYFKMYKTIIAIYFMEKKGKE